MVENFVAPEEERVGKAVHPDAYTDLIRRLSHQSVVKHFDAYADIDWDNPEFRIDHDDPRWELEPDDVAGRFRVINERRTQSGGVAGGSLR